MNAVAKERFPRSRDLITERFGGVCLVDVEELSPEICPKCGHRLDAPFRHMPAELGGGCIDHDDTSCPMCGGLDECERWCELARLER